MTTISKLRIVNPSWQVFHVCVILAMAGVASAQESKPDPKDKNAKADAVQQLDSFTVSEKSVRGYGAIMSTSGRLAQSYIDTPQMSSVVPSELFQDAQLFNSMDAIQFTPGVAVFIGVIQNVQIRGIVTPSQFLNGFAHANSVIDTAFADRLEVVRGPSPSSFGRGDPAGFQNFVTKTPKFNQATNTEIVFGQINRGRLTQRYVVDDSGVVGADQKTGYRFVSFHTSGAGSQTGSEYERSGAMLSLERNINENRGALTLTTLFQRSSEPGVVPYSSFTDETHKAAAVLTDKVRGITTPPYALKNGDFALGYASSEYFQNIFTATLAYRYKLSEHWSTRQALNVNSTDGGFVNRTAISPTNLTRNATGQTIASGFVAVTRKVPANNRSYQGDFLGEYPLPALEGKANLMAGVDYSRLNGGLASFNTTQTPQPLDSWNPNIAIINPSGNPAGAFTSGTQWSPYTQATISAWKNRVQLTGVARKIYNQIATKNVPSNVVSETKTISPLMPAYSLMVKPTDAISIYALHSEYLNPPQVVQKYTNIPDTTSPLYKELITLQAKTKLDEAGLKGMLFGDKMVFSICAYQVTQAGGGQSTFFVGTNPDGSRYTYSGWELSALEVKGVEFETFGQFKNWTFVFNGAFPYYSRSTVVLNGKQVDTRIRDLSRTLSAYTKYSFGNNQDSGFSVTAGAKAYLSGWETNDSGAGSFPYPNTLMVLDLGVSYGFNKRYEVFIKGNNLTNRHAIPTAQQSQTQGRMMFVGISGRF